MTDQGLSIFDNEPEPSEVSVDAEATQVIPVATAKGEPAGERTRQVPAAPTMAAGGGKPGNPGKPPAAAQPRRGASPASARPGAAPPLGPVGPAPAVAAAQRAAGRSPVVPDGAPRLRQGRGRRARQQA